MFNYYGKETAISLSKIIASWAYGNHYFFCSASTDYTDLDEELKFDSAGQKCVDLVTLVDSVYEGDEKLSVSLSYSQSSKTAIVTIKDDDQGM